QALAMPSPERRKRMREMRERVLRHDAATWARSFVDTLLEGDGTAAAAGEVARPVAVPIGAAVAAVRERILETLRAGRRVAMFLDYDGTLREIERDPSAATPTRAVRQTLERLAGHGGIDLTLISGRRAED